jgi:hypothetical protein
MMDRPSRCRRRDRPISGLDPAAFRIYLRGLMQFGVILLDRRLDAVPRIGIVEPLPEGKGHGLARGYRVEDLVKEGVRGVAAAVVGVIKR